jgi:hypothetical protein
MTWSKYRRDGKPANSRLTALEDDAVFVLRSARKNIAVDMRDRLDARHYLMHHCGWTADQVNEARDADDTNTGETP